MKSVIRLAVLLSLSLAPEMLLADELLADCPLVPQTVPRVTIDLQDLGDYSCESNELGEMCTTMISSCDGAKETLPIAAN